jgi:tetratricopeptide (TPR) repeat protein
LGEDDSFTGLIHLAFGIASQLSKEYPKEFPADFKTAVRGLSNDDAALAVLRSIVGRLGARNLLLVTENMDQTFHSLGDSGQKKWRAFLQETRKIATLATAQQLFSGVSDRNEAFFGFFDIQHLKPLSVDEAVELITRISLEHSNRELIRYLKSAEGQFRIRALHYLAGGNHRMYVLLSEFLTKESLDDLVAAFDSLANDMTPFFQERIRSLPDQQRQLVQCLCDAQGALTVKEVASETFIDERVCSKQLGNLKDKGYVRSEKRGKESYYDMAEPLMRLCLEVKNQHGRPLRLLARFLRAWFPVTELKSKLIGNSNGRVSDYCKLAIESGDGFKGTLAMTLCSEIDSKISDGDFETAEKLIKELEFADPSSAKSASIDQATARLRRGVKYHQQGDFELALSDYSAVVEMSGASVELRAKALFNRGVTYGKQGDIERQLSNYSSVVEMPDAPVEMRAKSLLYRGVAYGKQGDFERELSDLSAVVEMANVPMELRACALCFRGFTYGRQRDFERELADYSAVVEMPDAPVDLRALALSIRGISYEQQGEIDRALMDYSAVIAMPDAPVNDSASARFARAVANRRTKHFKESVADFEAFVAIPSISPKQRTEGLFAIVELMINHCSLEDVKTALARAFVEGARETNEYGGAPRDLLSMVLGRSPAQWANYISVIASMYIEYGCADKLGQGITKSIQHLDEGGFSKSQIESWNAAWQQAGQGCDALEIPLRCLDAAVEVMNSDPRSDRALFRLPLELRGLVRPLLNRSLGET